MYFDLNILKNISVPTSLTVSINSVIPPILPARANPIAPIYCIKIREKSIFTTSAVVAIFAAFRCRFEAYRNIENSLQIHMAFSPNHIHLVETLTGPLKSLYPLVKPLPFSNSEGHNLLGSGQNLTHQPSSGRLPRLRNWPLGPRELALFLRVPG